jgi:hypothetical protein
VNARPVDPSVAYSAVMELRRPSWMEPLDSVGEWVGLLGGVALVSLLGYVITTAIIPLAAGVSAPTDRHFEKGEWSRSAARKSMLRDIQERLVYPGVSKARVAAVLGQPEHASSYQPSVAAWWGYCVAFRASDCSQEFVVRFAAPNHSIVSTTELD